MRGPAGYPRQPRVPYRQVQEPRSGTGNAPEELMAERGPVVAVPLASPPQRGLVRRAAGARLLRRDLAGLYPPDGLRGHRRSGPGRGHHVHPDRDLHAVVLPGRAPGAGGHVPAVPPVRPGRAGQVRHSARRAAARPARGSEPRGWPLAAHHAAADLAGDPPPVRLRADPVPAQPGRGGHRLPGLVGRHRPAWAAAVRLADLRAGMAYRQPGAAPRAAAGRDADRPGPAAGRAR